MAAADAADPPDATPGLTRVLGGRRRLPAVLWEAAAQARAVREAARAEAQAIVHAAEEEAEELRSAAEARGREEGLSSVAEMHARVLIDRDRLLEASRSELVELAFAIAERVIGPIVRLHPDLVADVASRAVEASRGRLELVLRACPADMDALRAAAPRLADLANGTPKVRFLEDPDVTRGGVTVESELGRVDASIEAQLSALRRAVLGDSGAAP